jgi:hypothetical protein
MKNFCLTALIALTLAIPVHAQSSKPETPRRFELGWNPLSYLRQEGRDLWGGSASIAMRRSDRLSYVADFSIHSAGGADTFNTAAYRFGMRYYAAAKGKYTPFAEALAGGAHVGRSTTTSGTTTTIIPGHNGFSFATGGGVDRTIRPWLSWRVVQVNYSFIHGAGKSYNGVRIHTGGAFHF